MRLKQPVSRSKNLISRSIAWHVLQLSPTDLGILTTFLCAVEFISSRCSHSGDDRDQHTFKWTFYTGGQMCVGLLNVAVMKAFRHPYMDKLCNVINLILLHGCNGLSDAFSFTFCVFSLRGFLLSMTFVYAEASIMQFFVLIPCSTLLRIKVTMSRIQPTVRSVSTFLVLEVMSVVTGVAFYFSLYLIATEGVRLYRQPQLILRDVVDLSKTEKKAFRDLPFYFDKPFSVDEHLYLLLRITKIPALRPLILARLTSVNPRIQPLSPALRSILPPVHAFGFSAPKREASIQLTPSVSRTPPGPNTPTAYQALVLRDVPAHSMRCFRSSLHSSTKCNSRIVPYSTEHALFRHYSLASHAFVRRAIHRLGENREPHLFSAYSVSENTAVSTLSDYGSSFSTYATLDCRAHFATTASSSRTLTNPCFFWLSRLCTCCRSLPHKAHSLMLSAAPTAPSDWFTSSDDSWRSGISAPLPFPTSTASSFSPSAHHQHSEADAMCNRRQQIRALPPVDVFDVRCNPSSFLHATQKYYSSSTFSGELKPKLEDIEPYFLWEFRILSLAPRSSFLSRFYRSVVSLANRTMLYFRMMDAVIKKAAAIRQAPLLPSITALGCFRDLRIQRWYWAWSSVVKARYCIAMNKIAVIASLAHTLHAVVAFAWMKHYTQQVVHFFSLLCAEYYFFVSLRCNLLTYTGNAA